MHLIHSLELLVAEVEVVEVVVVVETEIDAGCHVGERISCWRSAMYIMRLLRVMLLNMLRHFGTERVDWMLSQRSKFLG